MLRISYRRKESIWIVWVVVFRLDALGVVGRWYGRDVVPFHSQRFPYRICGFGLQLNKSLFEIPELILVELILLSVPFFHSQDWLHLLSLRGLDLWGLGLDIRRCRAGLGICFTWRRRWSLARCILAMISSTLIIVIVVIVTPMLFILVAPISIVASIPAIPIPLVVVTS